MPRAIYHYNGRTKRPMNDLQPGDWVSIPQKPYGFRIEWRGTVNGEVVYKTDRFGVVWARELERVKGHEGHRNSVDRQLQGTQ